MQDFINIASHLADEAGKIARQYFRADLDIISKNDQSPVTIADQSIETRLREILAQQRANDSILGEEFDSVTGTSGYTWVIDPIDGTKSFIMGRPTFGTLIALWQGDKPILGLIDQPILKERWIGGPDLPTTFNGKPCKTRPCTKLSSAVGGSTTAAMFAGRLSGLGERLEQSCKLGWGSDCYAYGLLASGHVDLIVEADLKPHDFAALVPVIMGAGGKIADYNDQEITLDSVGEVIATGDPALYPIVKELIDNHINA